MLLLACFFMHAHRTHAEYISCMDVHALASHACPYDSRLRRYAYAHISWPTGRRTETTGTGTVERRRDPADGFVDGSIITTNLYCRIFANRSRPDGGVYRIAEESAAAPPE